MRVVQTTFFESDALQLVLALAHANMLLLPIAYIFGIVFLGPNLAAFDSACLI